MHAELRYRDLIRDLKGRALEGRLELSLASDIQEVGRVIDALEEFGAGRGIAPDQSLRFGLALDELITNIISYGLAGRSDGTITLEVEHSGGMLTARLCDNGLPFDPFAAEIEAPSGDIEHRKVGGLGVTLVKKLMDHVDYRRDGGFNHVTLELKLKAA